MNFNSAVTSLFERVDGFYDKHLGRLEDTDFYKRNESRIYTATFFIPFVGTYRAGRDCWKLLQVLEDALSPVKDIYRVESKEEEKKLKKTRGAIGLFTVPLAFRVAQIPTLMYALNSKSLSDLAFYTFFFLLFEGASTFLEIHYSRAARKRMSEILSKK